MLLDGPGAAAAGLFVRGQAWEAPDWWQVAERPADALHDRTVAGLRLTPLPGPAVAVEDGTGALLAADVLAAAATLLATVPVPPPAARGTAARARPAARRRAARPRGPVTRVPLRDGLLLAVGTLTVVRVPPPRQVDAARAGLAMTVAPVVGALLALPATAVAGLALAAGTGPLVAAALAVGTLAWGSGGLHLDGLADTVDGVAAGRGDRARSLEVMRQGQVGPLGAATLALVLLVQVAALARCLSTAGDAGRGAWGALALPVAAAAGRAALPLLSARGCPRRAPAGSAPAWPGRCPDRSRSRCRSWWPGSRRWPSRRRRGSCPAPARCGSRRRCWGAASLACCSPHGPRGGSAA